MHRHVTGGRGGPGVPDSHRVGGLVPGGERHPAIRHGGHHINRARRLHDCAVYAQDVVVDGSVAGVGQRRGGVRIAVPRKRGPGERQRRQRPARRHGGVMVQVRMRSPVSVQVQPCPALGRK
jgi:hypothetical protein